MKNQFGASVSSLYWDCADWYKAKNDHTHQAMLWHTHLKDLQIESLAKYLVTRTKNTRNVKRMQKNNDNTIIPLRKKKKRNMYNWSTCVWTSTKTWTARCNLDVTVIAGRWSPCCTIRSLMQSWECCLV